MNPTPIFWTRKCKVLDIYKLKGDHYKMTLNDETSSIEAIKWNASVEIKKNDLLDIAYYIEINRWKKTNTLQLNILDIKNYKNEVSLQLHDHIYNCKIIDNKEILITNSKGQRYSSDSSTSSENLNDAQKVFANKILTFAKLALGKAA
jgi:single-stranded-DNA-specific exonuclease